MRTIEYLRIEIYDLISSKQFDSAKVYDLAKLSFNNAVDAQIEVYRELVYDFNYGAIALRNIKILENQKIK